MDVLLATLGSAGDVFPFIALGKVLRKRGHRVTLLTAGYFEEEALSQGLGFREVGDTKRYDSLVADPRMWDPRKGIRLLLRDFVVPAVPDVYRLIEESVTPETVLVASSLAYGARIARESLGVPLATVHLQPFIFLSLADPPVSPLANPPGWVPDLAVRVSWQLVEAVTDRTFGAAINTFLKNLDLPPVSGIFTRWFHSPDLVLGLFPTWFGPPAPDWPGQTRLTGFVRYDGRDREPDPDLEDYLAAGEEPVVMSPGTAMAHGRRFFAAGIEACRLLGRRVMLVTGHKGHLPHPLPSHAAHFDYVPFSVLLPRAAAFIHHGGIGSLAQGLAGGIPQLVMPMNYDQPDNAARLVKLGAGDFLRPGDFSSGAVAARLEALMSSATVISRCQELASRIEPASAAERAADLIEGLSREEAEGERQESTR